MTDRRGEIERDMSRAKDLFSTDVDNKYFFCALQCLTRAKTTNGLGAKAGLIMQARVAMKLGIEQKNMRESESRKGAK